MKLRFTRLLVAGALGLAASRVSAQDSKPAEKLLKATLKQAAKSEVQALKALVVPATNILQQTQVAVSSGASAPGDSIDSLAQVMSSLEFALSDTTSSSVLVDVSLAVNSALSAAGLPLPQGGLVGTGGVLDRRLAQIEQRHRAAVAKGRKSAHALIKTLAKFGLPAALRTPDTPLPAFAPGVFGTSTTTQGGAPVISLPPLQLTALVGFSTGSAPDDGALRIAGFSLLPDDVKLSGHGPEDSGFGPVTVTPAADGTFEATVTGLPQGNWSVRALQPIALATDCVGIPGVPDPGADPLTAKQVAKQAKSAWMQLVKLHAATLGQQLKDYKAALKAARKALKGGADPDAVLDGAYAALDQFQAIAESATNGAQGVGAVADAVFGSTLDGLAQLVPDQLVGFGTSNDKASALVEKHLQKRSAATLNASRAFARFLAKHTDLRLAVEVEPVPFRRAAPVKGPELPALHVPLRFETLAGSSQQSLAADGVIRLRVSGDDSLGPRVDLTLFGPDGFVLLDALNGADLVGGLNVRIPDSGPGNLPEGNYVVVLSQGSVNVSAAIAVPGTP